MKPLHFFTTVGVGVICVLLSAYSVLLSQSIKNLQQLQQEQQVKLSITAQNQQFLQAMVQEMAQFAAKDERVKSVLAHNGFTIQTTPESTAAPK